MNTRSLLAAAAFALAVSCLSGPAQAGGLLAKKRCGCEACCTRGCHGCGLHGCPRHVPLCSHGARADRVAKCESAGVAWDGGYWHTMWGQPVALVVPPTAELQTHYNWGVAQTSVTPIWHQFQRSYPGPYVAGGRGFRPTPTVPSSTDQFGVYYIRGPW